MDAFDFEKARISRITFSDRYLGFYERWESVLLEIFYTEKRTEDYTYTLEIIDGWGELYRTETVTVRNGEEGHVVNLGEFPLGWYRLLLKSGNGEVFNEYLAFVVTAALSERGDAAETLATDVAAEYEPRTMALGEEFVRSLKLQGFLWLRGRTDMKRWVDQVIEYRQRLRDAGFKVTSASTDDMNNLPKIKDMDLCDIYTKYKNAPALNPVVNKMYEIQNEADLFFHAPPLPDTHTSYCKAAFIGLLDSGIDALTSMTSTAFCADTIYYDLTLQNGVLDYSNIYNFHGYDGIECKAAYARKSALAYSPEGSVRPTFMTENGKKVWAGEDGVVIFDQLQHMCRYAVRSCAQILSEGCDKWFWFITRAFLEAGGGLGNSHAWTHQPYPIAAVLSNLTYQLGKGIYKGRLSNLPEKSFGYLFDRGDGDVAILFSNQPEKIALPVKKVILSDMFGVESEICPNESGFVEIELSQSPVFLRFEGRADESIYYETSFELKECERLTFSEEQRVVLNAIWEDQELSQAILMQKGYLFNEIDEQRVTLRVYNLNGKTKSGKIYVTPEYAEHFDIEIKDPHFTAEPFGKAEIEILIRTTGKAKMNSMGDILFGAVFDNGAEASQVVCRYWFKLDDLQIPDEDITPFDGVTDPECWNMKNIMVPGKMVFEVEGDSITIKADHGGDYAQWYFPEFFIKDSNIFVGTDGIVVRRKHSHDSKTKLTAFLCTTDGRSYWSGDSSGVAYTTDERTIVYPWDTFILFASPEGFNDPRPFDPKTIYKIRIGASGTPKDFIPDTTITKFGVFRDNMGATKPHPNAIIFDGVEEGERYESAEALSLIATLPEDSVGDIRVFLGKNAYKNYTMDENKVYIDLTGLDRGEYTLQVSCKTKVNYRYTKYVTFFIER